ncbi:MAG TPA: hypothetical protein VNG51_16750 [Ktedonobacteraceae bacterium]|nr:hypothetical protein [Ktedonobacteraceae bacterium]
MQQLLFAQLLHLYSFPMWREARNSQLYLLLALAFEMPYTTWYDVTKMSIQ